MSWPERSSLHLPLSGPSTSGRPWRPSAHGRLPQCQRSARPRAQPSASNVGPGILPAAASSRIRLHRHPASAARFSTARRLANKSVAAATLGSKEAPASHEEHAGLTSAGGAVDTARALLGPGPGPGPGFMASPLSVAAEGPAAALGAATRGDVPAAAAAVAAAAPQCTGPDVGPSQGPGVGPSQGPQQQPIPGHECHPHGHPHPHPHPHPHAAAGGLSCDQGQGQGQGQGGREPPAQLAVRQQARRGNVRQQQEQRGRQLSAVQEPQVQPGMGRRGLLAMAAAAVAAAPSRQLYELAAAAEALRAVALPGPAAAVQRNPAQCRQAYAPFLVRPDYSGPGPLAVARLPRREHTCTSCFPACVNASCTLRVEVVYPKGGPDLGLGPPFPLAIFSAGFLLGSEAYRSYAERLASWGYTVLLYDRNETVASLLDDAACVRLLVELLDWAESDPLLRQLSDPGMGVYMVGHSRGGKLAALAGAEDARVAALCLLDPVDNTAYAPLAPGFPSALAALRNMPRERPLPLAVVGVGLGGDCAPRQANYRRFFAASTAPCWEVAIPDAGHFQFLDSLTGLQRAICPAGEVSEAAVRNVGQAVMVAWGESIVRHRGADIFHLPVPYPSACQQQPPPATPTAAQRSQLAQLQQRQGLRGQSSLAQAAYAAAWVQQHPVLVEPGPGREGEGEADGGLQMGSSSSSEGTIRESGQRSPGARGPVASVPCGGGGACSSGRRGAEGNVSREAVKVPYTDNNDAATTSSYVAESYVAESAVEPVADPQGEPSRTAPPASSAPRTVVVQEALRPGLDRLITQLRYDSGLALDTRYKNFDDDEGVDGNVERRLWHDERQWQDADLAARRRRG